MRWDAFVGDPAGAGGGLVKDVAGDQGRVGEVGCAGEVVPIGDPAGWVEAGFGWGVK